MEPAGHKPAVSRRTIGLICLGVLAVLSLVAVLITASIPITRARHDAAVHQSLHPGPSPTGSPNPGTSTAPADPGGATLDGAARQGDGAAGGGGYGGTPSALAGPRIDYFRLRQKPACTAHGPVSAIVEWSMTGVTGAALSVDNPGLVGSYRSYTGTTGSEELFFSCGGAPGTTESHVYTIYTVGGGPRRSVTINAKATVPNPATTPTGYPPSSAPPAGH
jgi:hypothetical protein